MAKFALTNVFLPALSNYEEALQGLWSQWVASIRMCIVPTCWQWLSQPILWIVFVSVTYWRYYVQYCLCTNESYKPPLATYSLYFPSPNPARLCLTCPPPYVWLSRSILWIGSVSVTYWRHSTATCVLMKGTYSPPPTAHLSPPPTLPYLPPSHPPTPYACHSWYYSSCEKNLLKIQQC